VADSLNVYSSAYEVVGYPPTYETNHALVPFIAPTSMANSYTDYQGNNYVVRAVCPNYSRANTSISAPISSTYSTDTGWTGLNIFSTAFSGQTYSDSSINTAQDTTGTHGTGSIWMTSDSGDIYPPGISGCTPAINAEDGGATTNAADPWWDWNNSNSGNCSNESTANQTSYLASGQPTYNNCALLIEPLGTSPPVNGNNQALLPDYYILVENSAGTIVAMDPVWDGQNFTDQLPGVITNHLGGNDRNIKVSGSTVTDSDTAPAYNSSGQIQSYGYTPTGSSNSYAITSGAYAGDIAVVEPPAQSSHYDFNPPQDTSYQCYNPRRNGNASGSAIIQAGGGSSVTFTSSGDNNNSSAVDPVANPQLGAILCTSDPPETYALYWNDLGT
jgi:hypothetical protein